MRYLIASRCDPPPVRNATPPPPRETLDTPTQPALGPRNHHRAGDHSRLADGPARRQPPRPSHALLAVPQRLERSAELCVLHVPRRRLTPLLPRLGNRRRHPAWPSCAPKPATITMTRVCTTSSGSCPPAGRTSAAAGAPTTSARGALRRRPNLRVLSRRHLANALPLPGPLPSQERRNSASAQPLHDHARQ
jgi:hypothetical protein